MLALNLKPCTVCGNAPFVMTRRTDAITPDGKKEKKKKKKKYINM
jgi:hypothetical protein